MLPISLSITTSRIFAVVQARLSSARLPGKVLQPLGGRPMLAHLLSRLEKVPELAGVAVATSDLPDDDAIAAFARQSGVRCVRGPLTDVLGRYHLAARQLEASAVVRISGDSPLLHPSLVSRAVALFRDERPDMVTNVFPRSFPKGQSIEIVAHSALEAADGLAREPEEREHVTPWLYRHADRFRILNFTAETPNSDLQLSVDTEAEFHAVERLIRRLGTRWGDATLSELIATARSLAAEGETM